jgi:hypothetical protein
MTPGRAKRWSRSLLGRAYYSVQASRDLPVVGECKGKVILVLTPDELRQAYANPSGPIARAERTALVPNAISPK